MSLLYRSAVALICCSLLALGCGSDEDENGTNQQTDGFSGGSFTVTVESVQDNCFDNAMNTVILPEGVAVDLPEPVSLPALSALPASTDIAFSDPFQSADGVDLVASGDNGLQTAGAGVTQTDVDINSDTSQEACLTQMTITAELIATDDDNLTGTGTLTISDATGDQCPVFQGDTPCEVITSLSAVRID